MMQNFVCMCTFISVSYKKHKGKHLAVKAISIYMAYQFGTYANWIIYKTF